MGRWLALLLTVLALAACKTPLFSKLHEHDANDALYTLLQGGIAAEKRLDGDAGKGLYSLWVPEAEQARALGLLKAAAQPEFKYPTLGELFARNQLISTPGEERIRFVYGTEQALAQTLSKIDGVLVARVHIVLPLNDPLMAEARPSSASVFIKHRGGQDLAVHVPAIKELVVRSVEGLQVDRVAVTLFPSSVSRPLPGAGAPAIETARLLGMQVPAALTGDLWLRIGMGLLVGTLIGLVAAWQWQRRLDVPVGHGGHGSRPGAPARPAPRPRAGDSPAH